MDETIKIVLNVSVSNRGLSQAKYPPIFSLCAKLSKPLYIYHTDMRVVFILLSNSLQESK